MLHVFKHKKKIGHVNENGSTVAENRRTLRQLALISFLQPGRNENFGLALRLNQCLADSNYFSGTLYRPTLKLYRNN